MAFGMSMAGRLAVAAGLGTALMLLLRWALA
jgi:hypothetical protein